MFNTKDSEILKDVVLQNNTWISNSINLTITIAEKLGYDSQKILKLIDRFYQCAKPSEKYKNTIYHGDLWGNNIMIDENLPVCNSILVGYQCIRYAPLQWLRI